MEFKHEGLKTMVNVPTKPKPVKAPPKPSGQTKAGDQAAPPAKPLNAKATPPKHAQELTEVETLDVPLDLITVMPGNPRRHFDPIELQRLAESIAAHGQLQPGMLRRNPDGKGFELFAGERRFRACHLVTCQEAGIKTFRATIHDVNTAVAIEWRGFENRDRADFNPIEEAIWFSQMIEEGRYTQQQLADKLGISQGEVSNTLRLLRLPKEFKDQIISGDITASDGRLLIPWIDVKGVLDEFTKTSKQHWKYGNQKPEVHRTLMTVLSQCSRPMQDTSYWDSNKGRSYPVSIKPTAEQLTELDVHDVPDWDGKKQKRAFNLKLWEKLADECLKKREANEAKRSDKKAATVGMSQAEKDKQFKERLWKYSISWKQGQILDQLETAPETLHARLLIHFALERNQDFREEQLKEALQGRGHGGGSKDPWAKMKAVPVAELRDLIKQVLVRWFASNPWTFNMDVTPDLIDSVATEIGVDITTDWRVDEAFLQLHTAEQLGALWIEWKLPQTRPTKKGDLVKKILELDQTTAVRTPKELIGAKRP